VNGGRVSGAQFILGRFLSCACGDVVINMCVTCESLHPGEYSTIRSHFFFNQGLHRIETFPKTS